MSASKGEQPQGKRKPRKLLVVAGLALVILGGGGGAFFWWSSHRAVAEAHPAVYDHASEPADADTGVSGALPFKPFVVNLADAGGTRYLKADIRLLVSGVANLTELQEDEVVMLRLRSAILEYLSQQTADQIVTPEGKEALKAAIAQRCSRLLAHGKVSDVLFAEFVVQF